MLTPNVDYTYIINVRYTPCDFHQISKLEQNMFHIDERICSYNGNKKYLVDQTLTSQQIKSCNKSIVSSTLHNQN